MRSFAILLAFAASIGFNFAFIRSFSSVGRDVNRFSNDDGQSRARYLQRNQIPALASNIFGNNLILRSSESSETEIDMTADIEYTKGMPDKAAFGLYYRKNVPFGSELTLPLFSGYSSVEQLLLDGLILPEDVSDLWLSAVGDATGLNEEESYEMLCMVLDLPDPDDIKYLDEEFETLAAGKPTLSFMKFLSMTDVQDMMTSEVLDMEEITEIWRSVAGDLNKTVDRKLFGKLNVALDDFIDAKEEAFDIESGIEKEDDGKDSEVPQPPPPPTCLPTYLPTLNEFCCADSCTIRLLFVIRVFDENRT